GDWDAYCRYRDRFMAEYQTGNIQYLVFLGDLIHRDSPPEQDKSVEMVLDVIRLQQSHPQAIIYLCGNHELAHIYNTSLARGSYVYTAQFEAQLGDHRTDVIRFFEGLPFFVRTKAGCLLNPCGGLRFV
ncbi:MAG: hypothetical protein AAF629_06030, partial [Chloroflexota bacterium]